MNACSDADLAAFPRRCGLNVRFPPIADIRGGSEEWSDEIDRAMAARPVLRFCDNHVCRGELVATLSE
jgi:hypothetical protein